MDAGRGINIRQGAVITPAPAAPTYTHTHLQTLHIARRTPGQTPDATHQNNRSPIPSKSNKTNPLRLIDSWFNYWSPLCRGFRSRYFI